MEKLVDLISDSNDGIDINNALALGTLSKGTGYSAANELFSVLNIPFMTDVTYQKHHENIISNIISFITILGKAWKKLQKKKLD